MQQTKLTINNPTHPPLIHSAERTHPAYADKLRRIIAAIIKVGILLAATAVTSSWAIPAASRERGNGGGFGAEWLIIGAAAALTSWILWGIGKER